jgi:hypothetical protein
MYAARAIRHRAADFVDQGQEDSVPSGSLEFSSGFKFVPSKREIDVDLGLSGQWKTVKADFKVNVRAVDSSVQAPHLEQSSFLSAWGSSGEGSFDPATHRLRLRLGLGLEMTPEKSQAGLVGSLQFRGTEVTAGSVALNARLNKLPLLKGTTLARGITL